MSLTQTITHLRQTHRPSECEAYRREQAEREYERAQDEYLEAVSSAHSTLRSGDRCPGWEADRKCCCSRNRRVREAAARQRACWESVYAS